MVALLLEILGALFVKKTFSIKSVNEPEVPALKLTKSPKSGLVTPLFPSKGIRCASEPVFIVTVTAFPAPDAVTAFPTKSILRTFKDKPLPLKDAVSGVPPPPPPPPPASGVKSTLLPRSIVSAFVDELKLIVCAFAGASSATNVSDDWSNLRYWPCVNVGNPDSLTIDETVIPPILSIFISLEVTFGNEVICAELLIVPDGSSDLTWLEPLNNVNDNSVSAALKRELIDALTTPIEPLIVDALKLLITAALGPNEPLIEAPSTDALIPVIGTNSKSYSPVRELVTADVLI